MKKIWLVLLALMVVAGSGCSIVQPGQRGVRITLGTISQELKQPGIYLWIPYIMGLDKIDVQVQKTEFDASAGSKDMQEITTHVAVNWSMSPDKIIQTYQSVGDEDNARLKVLDPAVHEVIRSAISQRNAEDALIKRLELKKEIDDTLRARLANYGITLQDVSIVNFKFTDEFEKAIESKQVAEQDAKRAVYVKDKAIQEANAAIEKAKGQAQAQSLVRASITPEILKLRWIEKWNGELPHYVGGAQAGTLLNMGTDGK